MQSFEDADAYFGHVQHQELEEGTTDSSNFFNKKQRVLALLSVLGLGQLKGCDNDEPTTPSAAVIVFTILVGFLFIMFCMTLQNAPQHQALQEEPEPEAAVCALRQGPITNDETDNTTLAG